MNLKGQQKEAEISYMRQNDAKIEKVANKLKVSVDCKEWELPFSTVTTRVLTVRSKIFYNQEKKHTLQKQKEQ